MKKLAIGCGILLVVLLVGGAVAAYVIYSKVKSTVAEFAALGEIPAIERGVRNTDTFTPPDSGELTEAQVARYVKVQQDVRALLGPRFDEFQTKYAELSKRMEKNQGTALDAPSVIGRVHRPRAHVRRREKGPGRVAQPRRASPWASIAGCGSRPTRPSGCP